MPTENYSFPLLAADQAQKHLTHNAALDLIDAALPAVVISATTSSPPASPPEFSAYIVPDGAAAAFGGVPAGGVAIRQAGAWVAMAPPLLARIFVADEGRERIRTTAGWLPGQVAGALTGAALGLEVIDRSVLLSGASVSVPGMIPAGAIVLGVSSWTIAAVTGAPSYGVGVPGEVTKFGGGLGAAAGSKNAGLVGPYATYAAANVVITATSGSFTGGRVGLALSIIRPALPVA